MPVTYDAAILQREVDGIYARAAAVLRNAAWLGGMYGFAVGAVVAALLQNETAAFWIVLIAIAIGGIITHTNAQARAYELRLEAQRLMLWMQIEKNTRGGGDRGDVGAARRDDQENEKREKYPADRGP